MSIIATLIIGLVAGWITGMLMKGHYSIIVDMILGIIGGFVGGWLTSLVFGVNMMTGINITSLIVAIVGAVIVVAVYRLIRGRSRLVEAKQAICNTYQTCRLAYPA